MDAPAFHPLSPRNQLVLLAAFGLYAGFYLQNALLVFLGALPTVALLWAVVHSSRAMKEVRVRRTHPPRAFEGGEVPVRLELETRAPVSTSLMLVTDAFTPASSSRARRLVEQPVHRRQRIVLDYAGRCSGRRGPYILGPVRVELHDDLGLVRREATVECFSSMVVLPTSVDLVMADVLGEGSLAHVGVETTNRAGASEEFIGLREYRPGDPPNAIHWRSTAKRGVPIVKEFREDISTDVSLFIDLDKMGLTGIGDQTSVEYAIKAAASLAKRAIGLSHAVQVFAVGERVEHIPLGSGSSHLLMILDRLALLSVEGAGDFANTIQRLVPLLRPGGTAVLLQAVTTVDVDAMARLIASLRQRRILPMIVLVDDRAFIKVFLEQETRHYQALSLEDTVRFFTLEGARTHVVTRATSRADAMLAGLEQPVHADA